MFSRVATEDISPYTSQSDSLTPCDRVVKITPEQWQAEQLRLTVFTTETLPQANLDWWKSVTQSEPETIEIKPALGFYRAEGPVAGARLRLNVSIGRVDWLLTAAPSEDSPLPVLGAFPTAKRTFVELVRPWLSATGIPIVRLAVGTVVRYAVPDKEAGYRLIGDFLPAVKIDASGSTDLMYQLNRPRTSRSQKELQLNRLGKWAVVRVALFTPTSNSVEQFFSRSELDLSTDPAVTSISKSMTVPLVDELLELMDEMVDCGDVP